MKITAIKPYAIATPVTDWAYVKVETEDPQVFGWGECSLPGKPNGVVGAIRDFEEALFYSASAYATVGQSDVEFPQAWRLVGAIEGLIGFLLIGWSTAVFITDMNKVLREDFK